MINKRKSKLMNLAYMDSESDEEEQKNQANKMENNKLKHQLRLAYQVNNKKLRPNYFINKEEDQQYKLQQKKQSKKQVDMNTLKEHIEKKYHYTPQNKQQNKQIQQRSNEKQNTEKKKIYLPTPHKYDAKGKAKNNDSKLFNIDFSSDDSSLSKKDSNQQNETKLKNEIQNMVQDAKTQQNQEQQEVIYFQEKDEKEKTKKQKNKNSEQKIKLNPSSMVYSDKLLYVNTSIPKINTLNGKLVRFNNGINYLYPHFDLIFKDYNCHIISCRKQTGSIGANYYISVQDTQLTEKNQNYTGKLRSTKQQGVFNIFGKRQKVPHKNWFKDQKNKQIKATVVIKSKSDSPRQTAVFILNQNQIYQNLIGRKQGADIGLNTLYEIQQNKDFIGVYRTRKPNWIANLGGYFLDFKGRAKESCQRNFIMQNQEKQQVLFCGRVNQNQYNVDISYPITPHLAIGIIAAQFEVG